MIGAPDLDQPREFSGLGAGQKMGRSRFRRRVAVAVSAAFRSVPSLAIALAGARYGPGQTLSRGSHAAVALSWDHQATTALRGRSNAPGETCRRCH
jgi:hypothetical protein